MAKNNGLKYAIGAVVLIAILLYATGNLNLPANTASVSPGLNLGGNTVTAQGSGATSKLDPGEVFTVTVTSTDALTEAALTEATNVKTTWLNKASTGTGWSVLTTGTSKDLVMGQLNGGHLFASFETQASGQSYVFSPTKTAAASPYPLLGCTYQDIEGDGNKEYVCEFDISTVPDQQANFGQKPTIALNAKYYNEVALTANSPSDQSSLGTTAGTASFIQWKPTGTAGDATFISYVKVTLNQTDDSEWDPSQSNIIIAGVPYSFTTATTKTNDGSNIIYEWFFSYTLDKAKVIEFPSQTLAATDMTTKIVHSFDSGDELLVTLEVGTISEIEAIAAITDAVELAA